MIRRPPRSTLDRSSAASDVYKRQGRNSSIYVTMRIKNIVKLTTYEERENKFNEYVEIESSKEGFKGLVIELLISLFLGFIVAAIIGIWLSLIHI